MNQINLGGYALPVVSTHGIRQNLYAKEWIACPKTGVTYQLISRYKSTAPKHLSDRNAECYHLKIDSALSPCLYFQSFRNNGFMTIEALEITCPYAGNSNMQVLMTFVDEEQRDYTIRDSFYFPSVGGLFHKRIAQAVESFQEYCKNAAERFQSGWNGSRNVTEIRNIAKALNVKYTYGQSQLREFTKAIIQFNDENNDCFGLAEDNWYNNSFRSGENTILNRSDMEMYFVGGVPEAPAFVEPERLKRISELFAQYAYPRNQA